VVSYRFTLHFDALWSSVLILLLNHLNFKNIANNDEGVHVNQITVQVSAHGYNAGDIKNEINNLNNEGHIYSTIDENNFQYVEPTRVSTVRMR